MARTEASKGKCYICKKELGKGAMKTHLLKCNNLGEGKTNYFMINVEGFYDKDYWLYIQVKENATLSDLDSFLRDIWLECCGHLSSFEIDENIYDSIVDDEFSLFPSGGIAMDNTKLKDVLSPGLVFKHDYDFGSTTTLRLNVLERYRGASVKDKITLLARNNRPQYICSKCGEKAEYIAVEGEWTNGKPLCEKCMEDYEDDESYIINITNSPRMGVCGYSGENDIYELE